MLKLIFISSYFLTVVFGMDCTLGTSENIIDKIIHSCPRPLIDNTDEEYCCINSDKSITCCSLSNFIFQWLLMIWPIILLVLLVLAVLSCICCCLRHICR